MGTGEVAGAEVAAVDEVGRGRGTRGGVSRGPAGLESIVYIGDTLPVAVVVRRRRRRGWRVKQGGDGHGRTGGRGKARLLRRTP